MGIIQGLTEFLPVSSSGHLELAKYFMGDTSVGEDSLLLTVTLHAATALATIWVFRKDITEIIKGLTKFNLNEHWRFTLLIILSMVPAVFVGLMWEEQIELLFSRKLVLVGAMLIITAILLLQADMAKKTHQGIRVIDAIIVGVAQALAILPGLSRSGATISTSVLLGVDRSSAARFSFLMVVPLILGKVVKDLIEGDYSSATLNVPALGAGFVAAFITGALACTLMIKLVKRSKLWYFSIYCLILGVIAILKAKAYI